MDRITKKGTKTEFVSGTWRYFITRLRFIHKTANYASKFLFNKKSLKYFSLYFS